MALAIIPAYFTASTAGVQSLPRPLVMVVLVALTIQALFTLVARDRDRGAYLALIALLVVGDLVPLAILVGVAPTAFVLARRSVGRPTPIAVDATSLLGEQGCTGRG